MINKNLGQFLKINLREIFKDEAKDFTPWLQKNIHQLSEVIGVEINDIKKEEAIGDFNCDLIGIEINSGDKIIIENQLEATNHDHLGKLITYASGIGAKYIVWITSKIKKEHQQALEWLNENTETDLSFFGIELEAFTIDESKPAIKFKMVVEPNLWGREVRQKTEQIDERHYKYLQFFTRLVSEYEKIKPEWGHLTPRPYSWLGFGAGRTGFRFSWAFRGNNQFSIELYIDTKDKDEVKEYFMELETYEAEINQKIHELEWEKLPDKRSSRVALYYKMPASIKKLNDKQIDALIQWAIKKMDLFKEIFPEYIYKLNN